MKGRVKISSNPPLPYPLPPGERELSSLLYRRVPRVY